MDGFKIQAGDLVELATVGAFASTDSARPLLTGVLLELGTDSVTAIATDSYRLATITRDAEIPADLSGVSVLIDAKGLAAAVKNCGKVGTVSVTIEDSRVTFEVNGDGMTYPAAIVQGQYPDWRKVIPADSAYDDAPGSNSIGLNPVYVGSFAKLAPWKGPRAEGVLFKVIDATRPVKAVSQDRRTVALLMPIRMS